MGLSWGLLAAVAATAAAGNVAPVAGSYSGTTSQVGRYSYIAFTASRNQVTNGQIDWAARCRSGKTIVWATAIPTLQLNQGTWNFPGSFSYRVPRGVYNAPGPVTGFFNVIENKGQFTSPISASGTFREVMTLSRRGKRIDTCDTGTMRWAAGTLASGVASPLVVPANARIGGLTYTQWLVRNFVWRARNTRRLPGNGPSSPPCLTRGQSGPVWFADDNQYSGFNPWMVTCHIPAGQYIYVDVPWNDCSTVEHPPFHARTDPGLRRCATSTRIGTSLAFDGTVISPAGFSVTTPPFNFTMPAVHNMLGLPGVTHGRAVVYGKPVMLGPLTAGVHTITSTFQYGLGAIDTVRYVITVS